MKELIWTTLFLFSAGALGAEGDVKRDCQHDATTFRCVEVVRVIDGDSVVINIPGVHPLLGQKITVRLESLDTPEKRPSRKIAEDLRTCEKQKSMEAKKVVEDMLKDAKQVDVVGVSRPKYFRILGKLEVDGKDVGKVLIQKGLAVSYNGGKKQVVNWCQHGLKHRIPANIENK